LTVNPRVCDTACAIIEQLGTDIYPAIQLLAEPLSTPLGVLRSQTRDRSSCA
jgi:hypothetical protein